MLHHEGRGATVTMTACELIRLFELGFSALDELAVRDSGVAFAYGSRRAQVRALFRLESGHGLLTRRQAIDFLDAYVALATDAWLDAAELTRVPAPWSNQEDAPAAAVPFGAPRRASR
jgi:hypothetical protein